MNYSYLTPPSRVKRIRIPCTPPHTQNNTSTKSLATIANAESLADSPTHPIKSNTSTNSRIISTKNPPI